MGVKRTAIEARLKLPEDLAARIRGMAREREMTVDALLSQLVQLGEMSLRHEPTSATDFLTRSGDVEYTLSTRK
jgi:hypothetical protein